MPCTLRHCGLRSRDIWRKLHGIANLRRLENPDFVLRVFVGMGMVVGNHGLCAGFLLKPWSEQEILIGNYVLEYILALYDVC